MKETPIFSVLSLSIPLYVVVSTLACTHTYGQIPAAGVVYGQSVETRVDSELAAYYLEHFADWRESGSGWARKLGELPACTEESLTREGLRDLSVDMSVDVAALYAAQCLIQANRTLGDEFLEIFHEIKALPEPGAARRTGLLAGITDYAVLLVPGWDYVESGGATGGDFAAQHRQFSELGIANYRVPVDPNGSVEQNAAVIRSEIIRISRTHEKLILVSASSSSPAVAHALGDPGARAEVAAVHAWLNLGGILGGMRLIDSYSEGLGYLALRTFTLFQGWEIENINSMSAARSHERIASCELPRDLVVINYVGIPFSGDISARVDFFYSKLREHGPNDGLTLVIDPILPGTQTIVALGQDHFFADDPELESRTLALATLLVRTINRHEEAISMRGTGSESGSSEGG